MLHDTILIVASLLASLAMFALVWFVRAGAIGSRTIASYKFQLTDAGKLEADFILTDGKTVSFVIDGVLVYDLSNALLNAASRMGAKRPGMIELSDPNEAKPFNPLKKGAP